MLENEIAQVRNSVVGVLRIHRVKENQFRVGVVGSAWCVVENKYFVTAHHALNGGKPRDQNDKFEILRAPENSVRLERVGIDSFVLEDNASDYAIFKINEPQGNRLGFPALSICTDNVQDGTKVMTYGYPAPIVGRANVSPNGDLLGIQTALFSHANEGIISSQYERKGLHILEFNIGWHHGESGGPVLILKPLGVICGMKGYRDIQTPHGTMPGPHFGFHISSIAGKISELA